MVITTVNRVEYNGDGINKAWPYTFRIIDDTDIKLLLQEPNGTQTEITSDYYVDTVNETVYYPGYAPGAEPPLADQPPVVSVGQKLIVYRSLPVTQEKDLGESWPFYVIELALDKLTMLIQDVWGWFSNNYMQLKEGASGWDAKGRPISDVGEPSSVYDAATKQYVDSVIAGVIAEGNNVITVDNVATLRSTDLAEGMYVSTAGYYDINDNGAGVYAIRGNDGDTDNGGTIIILDNGNVAELILNDVLNVKQFGAYGDNTHDDTAAFQEALNTGYDVFVPTSNGERYQITSTLTVSNPTCKRIYGEEYGKFQNQGGIFYTNTDADVPLFDIQIEGCNILNLTFTGAGMEGTFMNAHRTWDGNAYADVDVRIQDCRILSFRYGFKFTGRGLEVINNSFANIRCLAICDWVDTEESLTTHPAQFGQRGIRFVGNRMHMIYSQGVYVQSGHVYGFQFIDNLIDNGRMTDFLIRCNNEAWNWLVSGNTVNGLQSTRVFAFQEGIKNSIISNNVITADPLYWSGSSNIIGMFMNLIGCNGLTIQDNAVDYITNEVISFNGIINGLNISGNNFSNVGGNGIVLASITSVDNVSVCGNNFDFSRDQNSHYILSSSSAVTKNMSDSYCNNNTGNATNTVSLVNIEEPSRVSWSIHLIPTGTDLDTLTENGRYAPQNSSAASSLVHCPITAVFVLEVNQRYDSYVGTQTIYAGSRIYCRSYSSVGWGSWFEYTGTQV